MDDGGPLIRALRDIALCVEAKTGINSWEYMKLLSRTPREEYGDFGFPIARFYRGDLGSLFDSLRGCVKDRVSYADLRMERGFLNIIFSATGLGEELSRRMSAGWAPSPMRAERPMRIVVEHTSANPVHPLHIGHARNASLGDTLARMLKARGHEVEVRYYVNDMGRQVSVVVLGFSIINMSPKEVAQELNMKIDHAIGWIYAVTHTAIDLRIARERGKEEEVSYLAGVLERLKERGRSDIAELIAERIFSMEDPERRLSEIMQRYEAGLEPERSLVRSISTAALEGFMETLSRMGIRYDKIDWESDVVWGGLLAEIIERAKGSNYLIRHKDALALDMMAVLRERTDESARERLRVPKGEVPPMILFRSDGTTLYWTRDIAYSVKKFRESGAELVINVIAGEQRLPQLQIRIALLGLGYEREAFGMMHYDYEIVRLPDRPMSGRRGEYVSLDELIEGAKERALRGVMERNEGIDVEEAKKIAENIAVGAIRFSLVQPGALKPITFDIDRVLELEESTGPYLQYTYVRALGILEKHGPVKYELVDPRAFEARERRSLLIQSLLYPYVAAKAGDEMRPEDLASYLLRLADAFNSWYQKDSVIKEPEPGIREAKAMLVELVGGVLRSALPLLGVPLLSRM